MPKLTYDSKLLDIKTAMDARNQYDGSEKTGEAWKEATRRFLLLRVPMYKHVLKWAEDFGAEEIGMHKVQELGYYLDEGPDIMNHLLWVSDAHSSSNCSASPATI